jgi:tetratricopeptide (TPR) repeat protein
MKTTLLLCASIFSGLLHSQPDVTADQIQRWLERDQYKNIEKHVTSLPTFAADLQLQQAHAEALIGLDQAEAAAEFLQQASKTFPKAAELRQLAAMNQFTLAQQASIFSAAGHAKDGLALLKQATQLAPDDSDIQLSLIGFYLQAPGIAGGDEEEAKRLAQALLAKDPVAGPLAQAMVLNNDDKTDDALKLIEQALVQQPQQARLLAQKAALLVSKKQMKDAALLYQQAAQFAEKPAQKYNYLYQIGRLAAVEQQDKAAGKQALQQFIDYYQDGENQQLPWARVRLAQIHLQEQNKAAAEQSLQPVLALADKPEKLEKELKSLQKQLSKLKS